METLVETINRIKNGKETKAAKKRALVSLGLTDSEVRQIMAGLPVNERAAFTFGVEIECDVYRGAIRTASETTGFSYQYEGYNHNDGHSHFKFVTDASVHGDNPIECVSPVLSGSKGKTALKTACTTLDMAGACVNRSCGLHVHIGGKNITDEQYVNTFVNYQMLESLIDGFMAPSRRDNKYARSIRRYDFSTCACADDVADKLRSRYHKVNPMSWRRHRTIEFRQHQGSTNFEKIFNWVSFCGKLVCWSKKNRLTAPVSSIDDIPFLSKAEKTFFKARQATFAANA